MTLAAKWVSLAVLSLDAVKEAITSCLRSELFMNNPDAGYAAMVLTFQQSDTD